MTDPQSLLAELAVHRLPGTANHDRVRAVLTRELVAGGFVVMEQRFPATPYRLHAVRLWATALTVASLAVALCAVLLTLGALTRLVAVATAVATVAIAALATTLIAGGARRSLTPVDACNLIAVRARRRIRVWLVAHYDSKGQALSMIARLAAVALSAGGLVGLVWLVGAMMAGVGGAPMGWLALPGAIGGLLLRRAVPTDQSPGAVDNASGLITALAVADALPQADVGVLFTDAEEYGLLGAEALVRERANLLHDTVVINFDGIDDRGGVTAFVHRGGRTVDGVAARLGARRLSWAPVLVDGIALAGAARECVSLLKGGWQTMRVVHTPRDTRARLTLEGATTLAAGVAASLAGLGGSNN